MAAATIITVLLGFSPSLINTTARNAPLTRLAAIHGALAFCWLLVFLAQTVFVATQRIPAHRRLGIAALFLAAAVIVTGYMTAVAMGRRGFDLSGDLHIAGDPLLGIVNPLGDMLTFTILVTAGFLFRRRSGIHKRLMLFATVSGLMLAPLAHLIGHIPALHGMPAIIVIPIALFLFASAVYDRFTFGRVHPVSLWVALTVLFWDISLNVFIGPSAAWHRFAGWLIR